MKLAIMQPYFLPYIGYFQLIAAADKFVVYDNIEYTKKGWINRNRYLQNGKDALFSIPLKKNSDFLDVRERFIAPDFNRGKLLNQIKEAYKKAPYYEQVMPVFEKVLFCSETNLFRYILFSIQEICHQLAIETELVISSELAIDHSLKSQDKVIAICQNLCADIYINAIGGQALYSGQEFREKAIVLNFIKAKPIEYKQFSNEFVPWLSIIDVMMFNPPEKVKEYLDQYELIG